MLELWISIISITDWWIALIEDWISIKGLSFLPFHGTVGLLSLDLVALMSWGHQMIFIPWWRHQMGTSSALLALCVGNSPPVNSPNKGQWHGALMLSLICDWTNVSANNQDAGDLRRHRAHYDITVMHISSVIKISFCRISFSGHQNKFCACLDSIYVSRVILVMCKNCST